MNNVNKTLLSLCKDELLLKIFKGGFWNGIGLLGTKLLMFGSTMLFARTLSETEFGAWGYLYGMILNLLMFVDGPWSAAVTKYVAEYRNSKKEKAGQLIIFYLFMMLPLSIIVAILALFFPKQIAELINHKELYKQISIFLLTLIPLGFLSILKGVINGLEEFKMCSVLFPVLTLADVTIKCFGLWYNGFDGLVAATLMATFCQFLIGVIFFYIAINRHNLPLVIRGCFGMSDKLLMFTLPNLFYIIITCFGNLLVPSFFISVLDGTETLANYSTMSQLQSALSFLPLMMAAPLLAILSKSFKDNPENTRKTFLRLSGVMSCFLMAFGVFLILGADFLMGLYGKDYIKSAGMFRLFVPAMLCQILCPFFNQLFVAVERLWLMNMSRIIWMLIYIGSGWILRKEGLRGIVLATLISSLCWLFSHIVFLMHLYKTTTQLCKNNK